MGRKRGEGGRSLELSGELKIRVQLNSFHLIYPKLSLLSIGN